MATVAGMLLVFIFLPLFAFAGAYHPTLPFIMGVCASIILANVRVGGDND